MASWIQRIKDAKYTSNFDVDREFKKIAKASHDEPALLGYSGGDKNGVNPSVVCRKDGCVEMFSSSDIGIRIDPQNQAIVFRAPYIHFITNEVNFNTNAFNGMKWNKQPMVMSPTLPLGAGTILPVNTTAADGAKFFSRMMRNVGRS